MTEKRFTEIISLMTVKDNQTGKKYKCEMGIDEELLDLLNEQHETIQQLRKELSDYSCTIIQLQDKVDVREALLKQLEDENEQLKSELAEIKRQEQEVFEYLREYHNGDVNELKKELEE